MKSFSQLDEISLEKTREYRSKANFDAHATLNGGTLGHKELAAREKKHLELPWQKHSEKLTKKLDKRKEGIARADKRLKADDEARHKAAAAQPKPAERKRDQYGYGGEPGRHYTGDSFMPIGDIIPEGVQLDELSSDLLARYKKKASDQASAQDKEAFASGTSQKRARELLDKSHKRYKGIIKATGKQFDNDMKKYQKEEALLGEEAKHNEVHVSDAGGGKYKVHAVGKKFASGIKVGEHLTDTHLDDVSEMGGKIKMVKPKKD